MTTANRFGKRWTINECLQLQREYELLGWSIDTIAAKHQRTPNAIMFKLDEEELANYSTLYNSYHNLKLNKQATTLNNVYDHSEDVEEDVEEDSLGEDDASSSYCCGEEDNETVSDDETDESDDLRIRVNALETKIDELTQLILSQNKRARGVSSWFS